MKSLVLSLLLLTVFSETVFSKDFSINLKLRTGLKWSIERDDNGNWEHFTFPDEKYQNVKILMKETNCGLYEYVPCWHGNIINTIKYSDGFEVTHTLLVGKLGKDGDFRIIMTYGGSINGKFWDTNSATFYVRDIENMDMIFNLSLIVGSDPIQRGFYFDITDR